MAALGVTLANASEASADAGAGANVSCGGVLLAFGDALAVAVAFALPLAAATGADFMTDFIALLEAIAKTALTQQVGPSSALGFDPIRTTNDCTCIQDQVTCVEACT